MSVQEPRDEVSSILPCVCYIVLRHTLSSGAHRVLRAPVLPPGSQMTCAPAEPETFETFDDAFLDAEFRAEEPELARAAPADGAAGLDGNALGLGLDHTPGALPLPDDDGAPSFLLHSAVTSSCSQQLFCSPRMCLSSTEPPLGHTLPSGRPQYQSHSSTSYQHHPEVPVAPCHRRGSDAGPARAGVFGAGGDAGLRAAAGVAARGGRLTGRRPLSPAQHRATCRRRARLRRKVSLGLPFNRAVSSSWGASVF